MFNAIVSVPGVDRQGSKTSTRSAWWDTNLVRWYGNLLGPMYGWQKRSTSLVTGSARCVMCFAGDSRARWIAVGTHSGLFVSSQSGTITDITPVGFVAGRSSEVSAGGFGSGIYSGGTYGTPRLDAGTTLPAAVWDLDTWGGSLVGCCDGDGGLYQWDGDTGVIAYAITNAPTSCVGLVVTDQNILVALGAGGNPKKLQWSTINDNTIWTPSATNQAGDLELVTQGSVKAALKLGGDFLVWTDQDAHRVRYDGLPFVYVPQRLGDNTGIRSKRGFASSGVDCMWWSSAAFLRYNGQVTPVECSVKDYLDSNLNTQQTSKITAFHNANYGEYWWIYPSTTSNENDSYVAYDYRRGHWMIGSLGRGCMAAPGVFKNPIGVDSSGYIYEHELGFNYDGDTPFAETGCLVYEPNGDYQPGELDRMLDVFQVVADEQTAGQCQLSFYGQSWPSADDEELLQTIQLTANGWEDARFSARQIRMRVEGVAMAAWRFGPQRIDTQPGAAR